MTDQEINMAIAEACGWKTNGIEWWIGDGNESQEDPPDHCHDLNAMHEAADWLRKNDEHAYGCMCSWLHENTQVAAWATARERAEAFLRTIGKWSDK